MSENTKIVWKELYVPPLVQFVEIVDPDGGCLIRVDVFENSDAYTMSIHQACGKVSFPIATIVARSCDGFRYYSYPMNIYTHETFARAGESLMSITSNVPGDPFSGKVSRETIERYAKVVARAVAKFYSLNMNKVNMVTTYVPSEEKI